MHLVLATQRPGVSSAPTFVRHRHPDCAARHRHRRIERGHRRPGRRLHSHHARSRLYDLRRVEPPFRPLESGASGSRSALPRRCVTTIGGHLGDPMPDPGVGGVRTYRPRCWSIVWSPQRQRLTSPARRTPGCRRCRRDHAGPASRPWKPMTSSHWDCATYRRNKPSDHSRSILPTVVICSLPAGRAAPDHHVAHRSGIRRP